MSDIDIIKMGRSALVSHMESGKHCEKLKGMKACTSMTNFTVNTQSNATVVRSNDDTRVVTDPISAKPCY